MGECSQNGVIHQLLARSVVVVERGDVILPVWWETWRLTRACLVVSVDSAFACPLVNFALNYCVVRPPDPGITITTKHESTRHRIEQERKSEPSCQRDLRKCGAKLKITKRLLYF
jgi:hypothetical protein